MKLINHICYDITLDYLVDHYISLNYYMDTVVVVHNPGKYIDQLLDAGLIFNKHKARFDHIMVIQVDTIHDGVELINSIDPTTGPLCSLWHEGNRISDNIEENLRFAN